MTGEKLLELVQSELAPKLQTLGFEVVENESADVFDNAFVTLQGPGLRIRVVRERSQVFADFGPQARPNDWYDSAVVMDYLGLSAEAGFHERDAQDVLRGIASFVTTFRKELFRMFDESSLRTTTQELESLKKRRAERMFGG